MRLVDRLHPARAVLVAAGCCLLVAGCGGSSSDAGKSTEPEKKSVKENFEKVKGGMSETDVLDILGGPATSVTLEPNTAKHGRLYSLLPTAGSGPRGVVSVDPKKVVDILSQDDKPDVQPDVKGPPNTERIETADAIAALDAAYRHTGLHSQKYVVKTWEEADTTYVVLFVGGQVWGKGPSIEEPAKVTQANADKIKVGMAKAEVETVLGKGTAKPGAKIKDFGGEVRVWEDHGGIITIGFTDDKVAVAPTWKSTLEAAKEAASTATINQTPCD